MAQLDDFIVMLTTSKMEYDTDLNIAWQFGDAEDIQVMMATRLTLEFGPNTFVYFYFDDSGDMAVIDSTHTSDEMRGRMYDILISELDADEGRTKKPQYVIQNKPDRDWINLHLGTNEISKARRVARRYAMAESTVGRVRVKDRESGEIVAVFNRNGDRID